MSSTGISPRPGLCEPPQQLLGDLLAGLGVDLAGARIDEILGDILAVQILVGRAQVLEALLGELARGAHGQLLARFEHDFAGLRVDQIDGRLEALHALRIERHGPAGLDALVDDLVVEGVEDLLAVEAERVKQRRHRKLTLPVDARIHDVLGVELDVEPRAAIRNDAGGEQKLARRMGLALVVIEEHARRTVHLRDDDALGAVDDEGAVVGHERHVAHVDVLLLDVLDRAGAGIRVHIEHDQAQRHLERRSERHAALAALVDVVFRRLERVLDELEQGGVRKVRDRKHRLEDGLQSLFRPATLWLFDHQELVVGCLLNLDEVRHLRHFLDFSEELANALPADQCVGHLDLVPHLRLIEHPLRDSDPGDARSAAQRPSSRQLPRKTCTGPRGSRGCRAEAPGLSDDTTAPGKTAWDRVLLEPRLAPG